MTQKCSRSGSIAGLRVSLQGHQPTVGGCRPSGRVAGAHAVASATSLVTHMAPPTLLAVPNVSEGRIRATLDAVAAAFTADADADASAVTLLDIHSDMDHHRSVFTLAGGPRILGDSLLRGVRSALEHIDVMGRAGQGASETGQHPHVGAVDVVPIVYLRPEDRGAACAEALVVADRIGHELQVPVFLYGELSGSDARPQLTRAQLRRGGIAGLRERMASGEASLRPDFGPARLHPTGGATLVAARPPLVAFNLQLAVPATLEQARAVAARIREGGSHGLPGVRAMGVLLDGNVAQVSMNVERPFEVSLAQVVAAVRAHCHVRSAELVGLAPAASLEGFPSDLEIVGFDPARHVLENALG
jgi:glutamate formiminotransferase